MLSKLTFSLVLVLMLVLVAAPAIAQVPVTPVSIPNTDAIPEDSFTIVIGGAAADSGIAVPVDGAVPVQVLTVASDMPDLEQHLYFGGTIELQMSFGTAASPDAATAATAAAEAYTTAMAADATDDDKKATRWHDFVISEVMWGLDDGGDTRQWIEIYNNAGADLATGPPEALRLVFYTERITDGPEVVRETAAGGDKEWVLVDRVSAVNRFGSQWNLVGSSGVTAAPVNANDPPQSALVSMYRKRDLVPAGDAYKDVGDGKFWNDGTDSGSWVATPARDRTNITAGTTGRYIVGTPYSPHLPASGDVVSTGKSPTSVSALGVIINEVRNDTSEANLDWIELYHFNDAAGAVSQNLKNWSLTLATYDEEKDEVNEVSLAVFPDYKLQPDSYLVVYNRHPKDTILAGGVNIEDLAASRHVNKGSTHHYFVADESDDPEYELDLPDSGKFLIVLRMAKEDDGKDPADLKKPDRLKDFAGNGLFPRNKTIGDVSYNTDAFPLNGWPKPDAENVGDVSFAGGSGAWGRLTELNATGMWRPVSRVDGARNHGDDWDEFGFVGAGYDRDVDTLDAPGTPGYENRAVTVVYDDREGATGTSPYMFGGTVTISEVMYDAGPRWNLVQWIELYNSSMTETVNLDGWTLEIRNKEDVESYVDSNFQFMPHTKVLPNQTLLIVSGAGANDVDDTRVYNLFEHHRRELGLLARDSVLLSRTGFYLRLTSKIMVDGRELSIDDDLSATEMSQILMDEAGNVEVKGAQRNVVWELPPRDPATRQSLVRVYGTGAGAREIDGTADAAALGDLETSWKQSILSGAGLAYYGHRSDTGTPGFRLGGPLPVSLSSFRPVRNQVTGHVDITWVTQSELNNAGFNILRSETKDGDFKVINVKGIVAGHGTTSEKHVYTFTDTTAKPNVVYYYQIEDVSLNGKRTTLRTTHLRGNVSAGGKLTTTWSNLKLQK